MRVVVISDIHANFDALEGVLADLGSEPVDRFVCLGDVVGYYAEPQKCVDLVREMNMMCIQGNHDAVASGLEEPVDFNPIATEAILWTRAQLDPESRDWLAGLPTQGQINPKLWIVHGSLRDRDEYMLSRQTVQNNFAVMRTLNGPRAVLFGHTHRRAVYRLENSSEVNFCPVGKTVVLSGDDLFLVNPGGTGQPRDGQPGAPYAIVEDDVIFFHRAPYDVKAAAAKVAKLPFGEYLAERLLRGV
jgi:predicted phosphodiesterase